MRIAIMGTGGQGGFFGAHLARAGKDVSFVARGAQLAAIRAGGLTVRPAGGEPFTVAAQATDRPDEVGPVDLVLFAVKTYDLDSAAEQMQPLINARTMVLPLQNGVDNAVRLGRFVPPQQILGGVSYVSAGAEAPGLIVHRGGSKLLFGELAGGTSPRIERLLATFEQADLEAGLHPNVRTAIWEKFMMACAGSLIALTRLPIGSILGEPETAALFRGLMEEVASLAAASRVALPADSTERLMAINLGYDPSIRNSQYDDLMAGRRLEQESLNGAAVRIGRVRKIPTPLNFAVYAALRPYVDGPPAGPGQVG